VFFVLAKKQEPEKRGNGGFFKQYDAIRGRFVGTPLKKVKYGEEGEESRQLCLEPRRKERREGKRFIPLGTGERN